MRLLSRAEWIQLILNASSLVVESLDTETKEAEFARGMRQLAEICILSSVLLTSLQRFHTLKSHQRSKCVF